MKVLTLIRHAKSSWDDPTLPDMERPLNGRRKHDAPMMGKRLAKRGVSADLVVSSPAVRALTTTEIIAKELDYPRKAIVVDDRLYGAGAEALLAVIREQDDALKRVMVCGHNPELDELAERLSQGEIAHMPTCAIVELTFDTKSWSHMGKVGPRKVRFDDPKKG
jgi:phosphohistidine phosphatase